MQPKLAQQLETAVRYLNAGKLDRAASLCERIMDKLPGQPDALNILAVVEIRRRNYGRVIHYMSIGLLRHANNAYYHYNIGIAYSRTGELAKAAASFREAVRVQPDLAAAYSDLSYVLVQLGNLDEAIAAAENAVALEPGSARAHTNFAVTCEAVGDFARSHEHYRAAAEIDPGNPVILKNLGAACLEAGDRPLAEKYFRRAIRINPGYGEAYRYLVRMRRHANPEDEDIVRIRALLADRDLSQEDRVELHFALGKVLDDCALYDEAFHYFEVANRLEYEKYRFDSRELADRVAALEDFFSVDFMAAHSDLGDPSHVPVFVIGMPRSGTSLVEQILASHPQVYGAGESLWFGRLERDVCGFLGAAEGYPGCLTALEGKHAVQLAGKYLALLRQLSGGAERVVDKMLENCFRVGLIRLLFPNARIIHCRRNPLDVALSIYTSYFRGNVFWSYDLESIGAYYALYSRIMAHWRAVIPAAFAEVDYEALVENQEAVSRRLIDYIGLPWDPVCLRFYENTRRVRTASHEQVRRRIYSSSIGRWRHYANRLQPFVEGAARYGVAVEAVPRG